MIVLWNSVVQQILKHKYFHNNQTYEDKHFHKVDLERNICSTQAYNIVFSNISYLQSFPCAGNFFFNFYFLNSKSFPWTLKQIHAHFALILITYDCVFLFKVVDDFEKVISFVLIFLKYFCSHFLYLLSPDLKKSMEEGRGVGKKEALNDLPWEDEKGPSSIRPTLELGQHWENSWETGWSTLWAFPSA